ncbi:PEPxxWA-CTERM sorting domain-containing protein [Sphingobium sp. H33]|uniref:PEPxxWA-CTERM sorting domain-containing protein n=2 Tax=Sphingobium nicotianae TaxID=2782607 RepID=A0A9X1D7U1_9SPHN|nr:PEPxxWA-CTERM sorting domain-containing protein [Sphingobium nicotianae]
MFLMPATPQALTAIAMPEPTTLRSPVMGYLDDGCQPDLDIASGSIARAIDQHDCGKDRKRAAEPAGSDTPPSAFFAVPDTPVVLTDTPLPVIAELSPDPQTIPIVGGNPYAGPIHTAGGTPAALLTGVPEPASWAMMIAGFALAGGSLRRPRRGAASVSPA